MKKKAKPPKRSEEDRLLGKFQASLGCRFRDTNILLEALTHTSYNHENPKKNVGDYERLEFIGDAVLELAVSSILFGLRPDKGEGELTRARADLVNQRRLALMGEQVGLRDVLRLGSGEIKCGGAEKPSILAAAFEALIGAIYMDRGWNTALKIITKLFAPVAETQPEDLRDPRSILQEWAQANYGATPVYKFLPHGGPPHKRVFRVQVIMGGKPLAVGEGLSKKDACASASSLALNIVMPERYNK